MLAGPVPESSDLKYCSGAKYLSSQYFLWNTIKLICVPPKNKLMQLCYMFNSIKKRERERLEEAWISLSFLSNFRLLLICLVIFEHSSDSKQILYLLGTFYGSDSQQTDGSRFQKSGKRNIYVRKNKDWQKFRRLSGNVYILKEVSLFFQQKRTTLMVEFQPVWYVKIRDVFGGRGSLPKPLSSCTCGNAFLVMAGAFPVGGPHCQNVFEASSSDKMGIGILGSSFDGTWPLHNSEEMRGE